VNYTEEKNGARSKTNQSEKYLSNQQYISGEEEYRFDHRTHFKETDSCLRLDCSAIFIA
jgi:hypothetical protein